MKKIILAAALLLSIGSLQANSSVSSETIALSQNRNNNSAIPLACVNAFHAMYPGATTLKWARKGEGVYQVVFIYNGEKMTARYSASGAYLGK